MEVKELRIPRATELIIQEVEVKPRILVEEDISADSTAG